MRKKKKRVREIEKRRKTPRKISSYGKFRVRREREKPK